MKSFSSLFVWMFGWLLLTTTTTFVQVVVVHAQAVQTVANIDAESCQEETACQGNSATEINIAMLACNGVDSCSQNSGETFSVGQGGCNVRTILILVLYYFSISCVGGCWHG